VLVEPGSFAILVHDVCDGAVSNEGIPAGGMLRR
jgi:hypothetical protein